MVGQLVKNTEILKSSELDKDWWYKAYKIIVRDDFYSTHVLRLFLNINQMYAYKINMEEICKVLEYDDSVVCVYSPMNVGIIDIYPVERAITSKLSDLNFINQENAALIFLTMIVVPDLDHLKISGIDGIQQIFAADSPVWQIVKEERIAEKIENGYFLILNDIKMRTTGIKADKLINLCKIVGIEILDANYLYLTVKTPNGESPTKLVNDSIKKDKENQEKEETTLETPSDISVASKLVYAECDGSNLLELFKNPSIDATRTYSNNMHEIKRTLGIEAARTFMIKEIGEVLGFAGGYINPRHVVLTVDFMTSLGEIYGITHTGINKQPIGALEKASFQQAMKIFKEASGFGEKKDVSGVSASIYIGQQATFGTGY